MSKLKVYIESSFVCYLTGDQTDDVQISSDQAYTRQWWARERASCDVFVSQFVTIEVGRGKPEAVARRMEIVDSVSAIPVQREAVAALARKLIEGHALPESESTDALHIATAAIAGMDVLLTWNCKHMANPHTLPKTRDIITRAGYVCPAVMTPKTYLDNLNMEVPND